MEPQVSEKLNLFTRNTQEVVEHEELINAIQQNDLRGYWGTAPTGRVHIGYLIPMSKIADFLDAGSHFKILLANLHAHLDDMKSDFSVLDARTEYYKQIVLGLLEGLLVDTKKLSFVTGTDFELTDKYALELLKLSAIVTLNRSRRAGAEVVRTSDDPKLGSFVYPLMQSLDVPHLDCNFAFGGIDQRGIYMLSREILPKIGYEKPICIFNPLLPGISGNKMSASVEASKIDCLDEPKQITKKYKKSFCPEKEVLDNPVLIFVKSVIFPYLERKGENMLIKRPEKFGGNLELKNYDELENLYNDGKIHPADLKGTTAELLLEILKPVQDRFKKLDNLLAQAYPAKK